MSSWWHRDVLASGKLPLMLCFLAFVLTFVTTRFITRMIRDGRGPFRILAPPASRGIHTRVPARALPGCDQPTETATVDDNNKEGYR